MAVLRSELGGRWQAQALAWSDLLMDSQSKRCSHTVETPDSMSEQMDMQGAELCQNELHICKDLAPL